MKKNSVLLSLVFMFMLSLSINAAVASDTIMTEGVAAEALPAGWSSENTSYSTKTNGLFEGEKSLKLKTTAASFTTAEYEFVDKFSFYSSFNSTAAKDGVVKVEKSTDSGVTWTTVEEFALGDSCTKNVFGKVEFYINEALVILKVSWEDATKDVWLDDFCITKLPVPQDNISISSVSADTITVSYEGILFTLKEGTDDIYLAHDSIAYGSNDVTITASTVATEANISYTKQVVNPAVGESDTAIWVVTAEDGITTKTYKAVIARSEYNCKAGLLTGGKQNRRPDGWSTEGWNYASASTGNGGLYPGDYLIRLTDKVDAEPGSLTTPVFSQVGTLSFSAKFSASDYTESLIVQKCTDGSTWEEVKKYSATNGGGEIPSYTTESKNDALARVSLTINAENVMIRFQYEQLGADDLDDLQRIGIDDITCKATDYDKGTPTDIAKSASSNVAFKIYPNPATASISIEGDVTQVAIYSLSGQLLKQTTQLTSIDISDLQSGIYLVKADSNVKQLIVK